MERKDQSKLGSVSRRFSLNTTKFSKNSASICGTCEQSSFDETAGDVERLINNFKSVKDFADENNPYVMKLLEGYTILGEQCRVGGGLFMDFMTSELSRAIILANKPLSNKFVNSPVFKSDILYEDADFDGGLEIRSLILDPKQ